MGERFSEFGLTWYSIRRHKKAGHVSRTLRKARAAAEVIDADKMVRELRQLITDAERIGKKAENARQYAAAIAAVRELRGVLELIAKLTGQLDESARVNILVQRQQAAESEQLTMIERLTLAEQIELARLLAKAQGEEPPAIETAAAPALLTNGHDPDGDAT